ncbi:hypothetical protein Tco_1038069, partial [Tanacetum coccineum]
QHGGCEGGAAAAVTVDGGDGDDRDGVAVTCGGVKAAGDDGVEGVVVRGDGIGGVVLSGGDGDDMMVMMMITKRIFKKKSKKKTKDKQIQARSGKGKVKSHQNEENNLEGLKLHKS